MKDLMSINVYETSTEMVIMGSCLPNMQPNAFEKLISICNNIYKFCLETQHINMAITKLASMLARNKISHLIFASVDKSPHCIQLHYIADELIKITKVNIDITHYIAVDGELKKVSQETISKSKNLLYLENILSN